MQLHKMRNHWIFSPQEFFGVVHGLKPVSRNILSNNEIPPAKFEKECKKNSVIFEIKELKEMYNQKANAKIAYNQKANAKIAYISKEKELIEKAKEAEEKGNRKKIAKLLGYPECCAEFFSTEHALGITEKILKKSQKPFNWQLNFFYNFDSRLNGSELSEADWKTVERINSYCIYLINHVPCSFECKKSQEYAEKMKKILQKEEPLLAKKIEEILKKPLFYQSELLIAVFEESNVEKSPLLEELSTMKKSEAMNGLKKEIGKLLLFE